MKRAEQHLQRRPARSFGTADRHLWEIAAVRDLFVLLLVASLLWVVYRLNDVFMPVFLALILADVINPFVTLMERRWGWPRPLTISLILIGFALSLIGLFAWLGPLLYEQSTMLVNKLPDYLRKLGAAYGIASGDLISQMEESIHRFQIDPKQVLGQLFQTTGRAVGILTFILTRATYLALSITLVGLYVFFFSWHFNAGLAKLSAYVPETRKQRVFAILARMDDAIGDFFRGRLVIASLRECCCPSAGF